MTKVCVLTGYGINADRELAVAFADAGAAVECVHLQRILDSPARLEEYRIIAFPGGFSFGDHLGSGLALAGIVRSHLLDAVHEFVARGGLVLGICNGFQVLVKSGLLPGGDGDSAPRASLVYNASGHFIDRWVSLRTGPAAAFSPWLAGIETLILPIRHGEGRFVHASEDVRRATVSRTAFLYDADNPNGSDDDIAGVVDPTGRILGLMPHPEAAVRPHLFPQWQRRRPTEPLPARRLFANGVNAGRSAFSRTQ